MPNNKIKKQCLICSKEFEVPLARKNSSAYCSRKCLGLANSERLKKDYIGENNPFFGKKHSLKTKKLLSGIHKEHWKNSKIRKKYIKSRSGKNSVNWKGGRRVDKDGYILIKCSNHPNRRKHNDLVYEHRLVVEKEIGRYLEPWEVVHHINGVKDDNRLENLELLPNQTIHIVVERLKNENKVLREKIKELEKNENKKNS